MKISLNDRWWKRWWAFDLSICAINKLKVILRYRAFHQLFTKMKKWIVKFHMEPCWIWNNDEFLLWRSHTDKSNERFTSIVITIMNASVIHCDYTVGKSRLWRSPDNGIWQFGGIINVTVKSYYLFFSRTWQIALRAFLLHDSLVWPTASGYVPSKIPSLQNDLIIIYVLI